MLQNLAQMGVVKFNFVNNMHYRFLVSVSNSVQICEVILQGYALCLLSHNFKYILSVRWFYPTDYYRVIHDRISPSISPEKVASVKF